jgi:mono/diheme cytochrome c family protein
LVFWKLKYLLQTRVLIFRISLFLILLPMILTGHLGGSLTHGEDFLTPPPPAQWFSSESVVVKDITPGTNVYEAVSSIMDQKCISCHGNSKQKGGLRLDSKEALLRGGETGSLISAGSSNLLVERITLPLNDEEHMPPKERRQLTKTEIDFLVWWVEAGANFDKALMDLDFPDSLHGILTQKLVADPMIPEDDVEQADETALDRLRSFGVVVQPIARNSNYLTASFVNVLKGDLSPAISALPAIKEQLLALNLDDQEADKASWKVIGELHNLRKLQAKNTNVDDAHMVNLQSLENLVSLNLVGTQVTMAGLNALGSLGKLRNIYLYQTGVTASDFSSIQKLFPLATIDTGNYQVPILESDTTVFTLP